MTKKFEQLCKIEKIELLKAIVGITLALIFMAFFTGCESAGKFDGANKGVVCDDKGALKILKSIVDKKFNGDFEIEKDNIVIWDYNPVGRYTCQAKIKKIGEQKNKKVTTTDDTDNILAVMSQMMAPAQYGISEEGGWVSYYTYETTTSTKKNRHLYVEIFTDTEIQ